MLKKHAGKGSKESIFLVERFEGKYFPRNMTILRYQKPLLAEAVEHALIIAKRKVEKFRLRVRAYLPYVAFLHNELPGTPAYFEELNAIRYMRRNAIVVAPPGQGKTTIVMNYYATVPHGKIADIVLTDGKLTDWKNEIIKNIKAGLLDGGTIYERIKSRMARRLARSRSKYAEELYEEPEEFFDEEPIIRGERMVIRVPELSTIHNYTYLIEVISSLTTEGKARMYFQELGDLIEIQLPAEHVFAIVAAQPEYVEKLLKVPGWATMHKERRFIIGLINPRLKRSKIRAQNYKIDRKEYGEMLSERRKIADKNLAYINDILKETQALDLDIKTLAAKASRSEKYLIGYSLLTLADLFELLRFSPQRSTLLAKRLLAYRLAGYGELSEIHIDKWHLITRYVLEGIPLLIARASISRPSLESDYIVNKAPLEILSTFYDVRMNVVSIAKRLGIDNPHTILADAKYLEELRRIKITRDKRRDPFTGIMKSIPALELDGEMRLRYDMRSMIFEKLVKEVKYRLRGDILL